MQSRKVTKEDLQGIIEFKNIQEDKEIEDKFWNLQGKTLVGKRKAPTSQQIKSNYTDS